MSISGQNVVVGDNIKSRDWVRNSPLFPRENPRPNFEKVGNHQN